MVCVDNFLVNVNANNVVIVLLWVPFAERVIVINKGMRIAYIFSVLRFIETYC